MRKKVVVPDPFVRNDSFRIYDMQTRAYVNNQHVVTGQDGELYHIVIRGGIELIPLDPGRYKKERFIDTDKKGRSIYEKDLLMTETGRLVQLKWDIGQLNYYIADKYGYTLSYDCINNCRSLYCRDMTVKGRALYAGEEEDAGSK